MSDQLARGLFANFAANEKPFDTPDGMEENLRFLDDHIGLYTLHAPVVPGTPLPGAPANGDGQIFTDGSYAVYNDGSWKTYPARPGIQVRMKDGSDVYLSTAAGSWLSMRQSAALDAATVARDIYPTTAAGIAGVADGAFFTVPSADPHEFVTLYQRVGIAAVLIKSYPSYAALLDSVNAAAASAGAASDSATLAAAWASHTGSDVPGEPAGSRSAKSFAIDDLTPAGANLGGSAKDWSISPTPPDGVNKSAKSNASDADAARVLAQAAAAAAASTISPVSVADYAGMRAYVGPAALVTVTGYLVIAAPSGIAGNFIRDDHDTTSADNGGTILVAANGKRWKRDPSQTVTPYMWGAVDDKTVDSSAALQSYFTWIANNPVQLANCAGSFGLGSSLTFDPGNNANYLNTTRTSYWNAIFWDISAGGLSQLVTFRNAANHKFVGMIRGYGVGNSSYASRKTLDIFVLDQYMSYSNFEKLEASYARRWGVRIETLNSEMRFDYLRPAFNGSATGMGGYSTALTNTIAAIANSGAAANVNQLSALTLGTALPADFSYQDALIVVQGTDPYDGGILWRAHTITAFTDSTHITCYPWFNPAEVGETVYVVWGGGVKFKGSDTSVCQVEYLDTYANGVGIWNMSLYPPRIGTNCAQNNGIASVVGMNRSAAVESGSIRALYAEGNSLDVLQLTEASVLTYEIGQYCGQDTSTGGSTVDYKFFVVTAADATYNYNLSPRAKFTVGGQYGVVNKIAPVNNNVFQDQTTTLVPHRDNTMPMLLKYRDTAGITLQGNYKRAKLTGKTGFLLLAKGSGSRGQPTGTWTFTPSDATWSVNGGAAGASAAFSGMLRPTLFAIYADYTNKNWAVHKASNDQYSQTLNGVNPPSIAAGSQWTGTAANAAAVLGDIFVGAGASIDLQGLTLRAYVSANGTITYMYQNLTGGAVDLPAHNATLVFQPA